MSDTNIPHPTCDRISLILSTSFSLILGQLPLMPITEPPRRDQLLQAAKEGRSTDMLELLDDGANIECKDKVRRG
jgi:hypothetical protein